MPLYYVLLHLWLKLGDGEAFLRSLSVVFGVASVPLAYLVAKELLGAKAAATAALLLTINEFVVSNADYLDWDAFAHALARPIQHRNGPDRDRRIAALERKLTIAA